MISSKSFFAIFTALAAIFPLFSAAQNTTGSPPECVAAVDSRLCGDFAGQMIDLRMAREVAGPFWQWNLTGVDNVGKLDQALVKMMLPAPSDIDMYDLFGCPNWDGAGWRYRLTALCGYLAQQSSKCPGNAPTGRVCPDAWKAFKDSGMQMFTNTTTCPTAKLSQIRTLIDAVDRVLPAQPSEAATCVTAKFELPNCGFGPSPHDIELATAFCEKNRSTEICCSTLNKSIVDIANPAVGAPKPQPTNGNNGTTSAAEDTSSLETPNTGLSVAAIGAIAGGAGFIVIVALIGTIFWLRRRRHQQELWLAHTRMVQQSSKSPTYGSEFSQSPSRQSPFFGSSPTPTGTRTPTPTQYYGAPPRQQYYTGNASVRDSTRRV